MVRLWCVLNDYFIKFIIQFSFIIAENGFIVAKKNPLFSPSNVNHTLYYQFWFFDLDFTC